VDIEVFTTTPDDSTAVLCFLVRKDDTRAVLTGNAFDEPFALWGLYTAGLRDDTLVIHDAHNPPLSITVPFGGCETPENAITAFLISYYG